MDEHSVIEQLKKGEVDLGTSIMAVQFEGGVVLGADTRTSMGTFVSSRLTDKLTAIHDYIYCCRSGSSADTQAIADIVRYYMELYDQQWGQPPVQAAAALFQDVIYTNKAALSASMIIAGWDKEAGPSVYVVPIGGGMFKQPWAISGSGSTYVYGYCDSEYRHGRGRDETITFVKNTLALAMSRDSSSGGCIRLCIITEDGVDRQFIPGDQLPRFWEGVPLPGLGGKNIETDVVPMAQEA